MLGIGAEDSRWQEERLEQRSRGDLVPDWFHNALITKGICLGLWSPVTSSWRAAGGVALWPVAADKPTLCELLPLHKGPIVQRRGPREGPGPARGAGSGQVTERCGLTGPGPGSGAGVRGEGEGRGEGPERGPPGLS
ncbi:hypothetical protein EYF80_051399 [Liparis tanakae]|uniref:Uncharacterized protein n=1 Tax=Liparis tanakae TaxID=230148 RepID=A0A4Z2FCD4_9TELE|nr:hypothetical protein EYF80_051399 [Liparis tanakae]